MGVKLKVESYKVIKFVILLSLRVCLKADEAIPVRLDKTLEEQTFLNSFGIASPSIR